MHRRGLHRRGEGRAGRSVLLGLRPEHAATTRSSTRMHEASARSSPARRCAAAGRSGRGEAPAGRQHRRRAAPRDARPGVGLLRLQRSGDRDRPVCWSSARERIAYVDIDVHHGDGVQDDVLRRPAGADDQPARDAALAVPGHRLPATRPAAPGAEGSAVNVAAAARHRRRRLAAGVPRGGARPCCARSGPQLLFTQCGADTHRLDPLANLRLTVDGQRAGVPRRCATWPRSCARAAGSPPAAAGTRWSRPCRARGPTCWRSSPASRWTPPRLVPLEWSDLAAQRAPAPDLPAADDRRRRPRPTSRGAGRRSVALGQSGPRHPQGGLPDARPGSLRPRD